jgi:replicative superfamily II helicase
MNIVCCFFALTISNFFSFPGGVNLPCHLVVIKGTEYFDAKTCTYVDFPVTDILQMMGR